MAKDSYLDDLAQVPLFSRLDRKDLEKVARLMTELSISAGSELMSEGGRAGSFVIIESGTAEVSREGTVIAEVGPGSFVGELSLILAQPPNATVRAKTDMIVHVADRGGFSQLLDEPGLARQMLEVVAARLATTASEVT